MIGRGLEKEFQEDRTALAEDLGAPEPGDFAAQKDQYGGAMGLRETGGRGAAAERE